MSRESIRKVLFTLLSLVGYVQVSLGQCSMCAATVDSNKGESLIGSGLNTGIIFLMITPYLLLGTIAFVWYRYSRKNKTTDNH